MRNQIEWAIHCCALLLGLGPHDRISTKTLAEFHGVPKEYLSKALQSLARANLIEGTLGPTGGYRLALAPEKISILEIVEAIEGRSHSFECTEIRANNPCLKKSDTPKGVCAIARVMYRADESWRKELRAVTLKDIGLSVSREVAPEQLKKNFDWLTSR